MSATRASRDRRSTSPSGSTARVAVSAVFHVEQQHTWIEHHFQLDPGEHAITVTSGTGETVLAERFDFTAEKYWAVVSYWFEVKDPPACFTFTIYDGPIGFV